MKFWSICWLIIGLPLFSSLLIFKHDTALAGYSKCKSVTREAPTPYCFKRGDSGRLIKILVEDLREAGYYQGKSITQFNFKVQQAVIKFQKDYRTIEGSQFAAVLTVDGIVGEDTLIRLCQALGRGCGPDATNDCYTGSPRNVIGRLDRYK
jgi:peptidoglycan hydrolase-like protein with peptidoglycan-binding domain